MSFPRQASFALCIGLAIFAGCAGGRGPWSVAQLEARHPAVADARGHRLADLVPYVWPQAGELVWFACRWVEADPIRVAYAEGVSAGEGELLTRALDLWALAVPGLAFERVDVEEGPQIRVSVGSAAEGFSGQTSAECALDPTSVTPGAERVDARLLHAEVELRRSDIDKLRRSVPLSESEFLATAVHEIGHALGFQGHVRGAPSVLRREVGRVRGMGEGLLEGRSLREPSMQALYAVPSGTVVARRPLPPERTAAIGRLAERAREEGHRGPTVRISELAARLSWWREDGRRLGATLKSVKPALRKGEAIEIELDLLAQALLGP